MKKGSKVMAWVLMLVCVSMVFMGCNTKKDDQTTDTANKEEEVTLNIWHIWTDSEAGDRKAIDEYIDLYTKEHPNVKIEQDASDTESYKTKLKVAFSGGDLPDIFFTYGAGFSKLFVETGRVLALDDILSDETKSKLVGGAETNFIYNDKLYGLPIKMWTGTFYCNKELFEKEGIELPTDWDKLMTAVENFRAKGYQPMTLGAKDSWHIAMYFDQIAIREAGVDGVMKAMNGEKKFNDPEFLKAAEDLVALVNADAFNDGFEGLGAQEAQAEFLMGRIPMYFNGSWMTGDMQSDINSVKDKIVALPFPSIPGQKGDQTQYSGGAIDGWSISGESKNKEVAADFLAGLAEFQSNASYKSGDGIAVWKTDIDESELNSLLVQINDNVKSATGFALAWDTLLSGADVDIYLSNLQYLVGGGLTPQEFVDKLQNELSVSMK
jgi:raffinose/stachyose/melibiose transport system substrate-binding protein